MYLSNWRRSAKRLENPSCHSAYEAWKAAEDLSRRSTEKARNDLVARSGKTCISISY